jgi:hypothetical protein
MNERAVSEREMLLYSWHVVGALFFATFLVVGTRQGFGVFVATWAKEWGVSAERISAATVTPDTPRRCG